MMDTAPADSLEALTAGVRRAFLLGATFAIAAAAIGLLVFAIFRFFGRSTGNAQGEPEEV